MPVIAIPAPAATVRIRHDGGIMAAEKKMDEEAEASEGAGDGEGEVIEGQPKKGKKKLLIIGAVLLLAAVGAGLFFSGVLGDNKAAEEEQKNAEDAKKEEDAKLAAIPVYYELPQFLVNLNGNNGRVSFLKMSVTLQIRDKAAVATLDANKPRILDTFNTYLRELRPSDIQGSAGIYHLRNELMARLNATIEEGIVKDILFGEIIVQ